jgi:hypothetical protein
VTDAQRTFDLHNERALNQERRAFEFPFAGLFGLDFARTATVQTGDLLLDHPLPALLEALDAETGGRRFDRGRDDRRPVHSGGLDQLRRGSASTRDAPSSFHALDQRTRKPRRRRHDGVLHGYTPSTGATADGPDERDGLAVHQVSLMFQVDFLPGRRGPGRAARIPPASSYLRRRTRRRLRSPGSPTACGTCAWRGRGRGDRVRRPAGDVRGLAARRRPLARIDAANRLVPGKQVEAVIVTHHHFDHTGGLRAAVSRGLEVIRSAATRESSARWPRVRRSTIPTRWPHTRISWCSRRSMRSWCSRTHATASRSTACRAQPHAERGVRLPSAERITMEGDFGDEAWQLHWWGSALAANIAHYGIDPETNIAVHGSGPLSDRADAGQHPEADRRGGRILQDDGAGWAVRVRLPGAVRYTGPRPLTPR